MLKPISFIVVALTLVACGKGANVNAETTDGAKSTTSSGKSRSESAPAVSSSRTIPSGTRVSATIENQLSSRTAKPGESFTASVSRDVTDNNGRVVVPAGSTVGMRVEQLEPGSDQVRPEGRISLSVVSMTINGQTYPVNADLEPVTHRMQGRGVTTDEAARVGAGTAIGAGIGQIIGTNQKGTIIGGAVGAVAGGAVAARYAYRDIIVDAGTPIAFTMSSLTVAR